MRFTGFEGYKPKLEVRKLALIFTSSYIQHELVIVSTRLYALSAVMLFLITQPQRVCFPRSNINGHVVTDVRTQCKRQMAQKTNKFYKAGGSYQIKGKTDTAKKRPKDMGNRRNGSDGLQDCRFFKALDRNSKHQHPKQKQKHYQICGKRGHNCKHVEIKDQLKSRTRKNKEKIKETTKAK